MLTQGLSPIVSSDTKILVLGTLPGAAKRCALDVQVDEEVDGGSYVRRLIRYSSEPGGRVPVDENFQTNVPGVYALGDLIHGPMLAHKAEEDGVACVERLAGKKTHVNYDTVPSVIYTWPEVASVGQTEEQVKQSGREYKVGKFPFTANPRARCMDETEGTVKILADAKTDRVLGVHIFGPRASEMIAEAVTTMEFVGSAEDIARIVHAHPTLSEALGEAARVASFGKAIHS